MIRPALNHFINWKIFPVICPSPQPSVQQSLDFSNSLDSTLKLCHWIADKRLIQNVCSTALSVNWTHNNNLKRGCHESLSFLPHLTVQFSYFCIILLFCLSIVIRQYSPVPLESLADWLIQWLIPLRTLFLPVDTHGSFGYKYPGFWICVHTITLHEFTVSKNSMCAPARSTNVQVLLHWQCKCLHFVRECIRKGRSRNFLLALLLSRCLW